MTYNPQRHHRRSIRLSGYDYRQSGAYFITICTVQKQCLFGEIDNGKIILNSRGHCVLNCWNNIPKHFPIVQLDAFVVMPNHIHGILTIEHPHQDLLSSPQNSAWQGTKSHSLPAIIQNFKSVSTRKINSLNRSPGMPLWQRNYYEHIIRNEIALDRIRQYIENNPKNWLDDRENPSIGFDQT